MPGFTSVHHPVAVREGEGGGHAGTDGMIWRGGMGDRADGGERPALDVPITMK
jgi:hypothetical protein